MLIKYCETCVSHEVKQEGIEQMRYCSKESCWAQFSKCLSRQALKVFLEKESFVPSKWPASP
jgi:hypothetical protein